MAAFTLSAIWAWFTNPVGAFTNPLSRVQWQPVARDNSAFTGMVFGMATQKITVPLDDDQVTQIRALVAAGRTFLLSCSTPWVSLCTMRQDGKKCWTTRSAKPVAP